MNKIILNGAVLNNNNEINVDICKNNYDYLLNKNKQIRNIIKDPIFDYPESAIVQSCDHYDVGQLSMIVRTSQKY